MFWFSWDSKFKVTKWQLWKKLVEEGRGTVILFFFVLVCYILLALCCGSSQLSCQVCLSLSQAALEACCLVLPVHWWRLFSFQCPSCRSAALSETGESIDFVLRVSHHVCVRLVKKLTLSFMSWMVSVCGWSKQWLWISRDSSIKEYLLQHSGLTNKKKSRNCIL